jgi:hypothetical protein
MDWEVHFSEPCSSFDEDRAIPRVRSSEKCSLETAIRNGVDYEGGTTVGMLRVMSRRGDDRLTWDEQKVVAGDLEAIAAVREAERIFAQERAKGSTAFRVEPGKPIQRIDQFDATAEQIVMVPRVVGG